MPKFKVGDIINSSISSPQIVEAIRLGEPNDFAGKFIDYTGEQCYVLRYLSGKKMTFVYAVEAIDKDSHLKGSEMFELYEEARKG